MRHESTARSRPPVRSVIVSLSPRTNGSKYSWEAAIQGVRLEDGQNWVHFVSPVQFNNRGMDRMVPPEWQIPVVVAVRFPAAWKVVSSSLTFALSFSIHSRAVCNDNIHSWLSWRFWRSWESLPSPWSDPRRRRRLPRLPHRPPHLRRPRTVSRGVPRTRRDPS
jgi:hypothetical protein